MSLVNIFCGAKFLKDNMFIIHPMCGLSLPGHRCSRVRDPGDAPAPGGGWWSPWPAPPPPSGRGPAQSPDSGNDWLLPPLHTSLCSCCWLSWTWSLNGKSYFWFGAWIRTFFLTYSVMYLTLLIFSRCIPESFTTEGVFSNIKTLPSSEYPNFIVVLSFKLNN